MDGAAPMTVTPEQAKMLTALVIAIRPHCAPHWDAPGVMAALKRVAHLRLADVTRAAVNAAEDPTLKTPAPIGIPSSPCWADKVLVDRPVREPFDRSTFCGICGEPRDRCERKWAGDHVFESVGHAMQRKGAIDLAPVVTELKGHLEPTRPEPTLTTEETEMSEESA